MKRKNSAPKLPGRNIKVRDVATGVWEDADGNLHFDCKALCEMVGVKPTPENIRKAQDLLEKECQKDGTPFVRRDEPDTDE